jgi:holo-[acyl-carrier protein] synthase
VWTERAIDVSVRVGIDLVSIARLERLLDDHDTARQDVFTERELDYCQHKRRCVDHLAARFAAKEAVLKALGTGMAKGARWTDVEVLNTQHGRPTVHLHGRVATLAARRGLRELDLSLSHSGGLAVASVVSLWTKSDP